MTRCTDLDDETHDVLQAVTRAGTTPRHVAKTTPTNLAEAFDIPRSEVRMLLADLETDGFLDVGHDSRIWLHEGCSCRKLPESLDSQGGSEVSRGHAQAGRHHSSSQGASVPPPKGGKPHPLVRRTQRRNSQDPEKLPETPTGSARTSPEPGRVVSKRRARRKRPAPKSPYSLAAYWDKRLMRMCREHGLIWVGGNNAQAMRGSFARWIKSGDATPELIVAMIDEFCRSPAWIRDGVPAWKSFLASRQALTNRALNVVAAEQPCAEADDWLAFDPPSESRDADDWLAR